ncbi:MAG TPA: trypsin-like peptidase domain-containing protein [Planctomycetota bacterium]|nr:trypsin-like peptidase domain-containing protein [Planctomycetota bacterium]
MKRTLLEILAGSAVGVLLFSLHHQVARLRHDAGRVADLDHLVRRELSAKADADEARRVELLSALERKLADLEVRIAEASQQSADAGELRAALQRDRDEYSRFRQEILRDVHRTQSLIDTYVDELRTSTRRAQTTIEQTRSELSRVAEQVTPDHDRLSRTMLAPTVQLNGSDTVGSGTLIWSAENPASGQIETYVLTSYHVVRNILADTPSAKTEGVQTTIWCGEQRHDVRADMILHEVKIDAALLKLRSSQRWPHLASVLPRERICTVAVWDPIYAVGCPLGNDPIPTQGAISSLRNELNGTNYWMINAPTYFGNSGGGIYLAETRELIGVFSKIYTHGKGNPVVIPHMGLCTPIAAIYEWLTREKMDWVLGSPQDVAAAAAPAK